MNQQTEYKTIEASRLILMAGLSLACLVTPARSQEVDDEVVYELDAYSLSASRIEIPIQQVGSSVTVLDSFELQKGEDRFLLDSLREVPGLVFRNNGGPGATFGTTVRGMSTNRPKVLVNGIDVSNPSNGSIINLGNLFTGASSRVEVLRGPQSSLYGADALAGVISVDTLGADQPLGGRASFGYGSYETYDYSLGYTGSAGGLSWSVDSFIHESEGYSAQSPEYGPAWADDDTYDNTSFTGAFNYAISEDTNVFGSLLYMDTYSEFDPGDPAFVWGVPGGDNYATTEQLFAKVGSDFRIRENWTSTGSVELSDVKTLSYTDGSPYESNGDRYKIEWVNRVEASENWSLVAGVEHQIEDNRSDVGDRDDTSLYVENVLAVSEALDLTIGARHDDNSAYGDETTYRTTFSYRIDDADTRIHGAFGTSFQAPSFYQLFNGFYGNPDLKPETGEGWDLGVETSFARGLGTVGVTLFGNEVKDKIVWENIYQNVANYESQGIEASFRYFLTESLRFKLAHTYSDAEEDGGLEALRVPRNVSSVGFNWSGLDGQLNLNLSALLVSSQFSSSADRAVGERLDGYEVVNLGASYAFSERYTFWLRVGNLLDKDYEEIAGYQSPGANANAGIRLKF